MTNSNIYNSIGFLFDLDGVLIDSEQEYTKIWTAVNKKYPSDTHNLPEVIKGCTLEKILDEHYPDKDKRGKVVSMLYELEAKMTYNYKPGALDLLRFLKERKIAMALVTSSNEKKMSHLYEDLPDFRQYFEFIVTADMIQLSKPDPECFLLGAEMINRNIEKCIVFEDSLQGVMAGSAAGAFVVGVEGTLSADILSPYSDIVVNSLKKINPDKLVSIINEQ